MSLMFYFQENIFCSLTYIYFQTQTEIIKILAELVSGGLAGYHSDGNPYKSRQFEDSTKGQQNHVITSILHDLERP